MKENADGPQEENAASNTNKTKSRANMEREDRKKDLSRKDSRKVKHKPKKHAENG